MSDGLSHAGEGSTLLQKALAVAVVVSSIAVPVATAYIAGKYAAQNAQRDANTRLVELAVNILQQSPKSEAVDIRSWALDVLAAHSDVEIPLAARKSLEKATSLPIYVVQYAPWEKGRLWLGGAFVVLPDSISAVSDTGTNKKRSR